MAKSIHFFPTLDIDQISAMEYSVNYSFSYKSKETNTIIPLSHTVNKNIINLATKDSSWDPYNYDLFLNVIISANKLNELYGPSGIAPSNSQLSFCLEWLSQKSKKRDIIICSNKIENILGTQTFSFDITFSKNTFVHDIDLNLLVFLSKKADILMENEEFLNNNEGVVLGNLDNKVIYMTGIGSLFPIYIKKMESDKLWDVEFDFNEPAIDKLSESIKLILNCGHKDYKYLDPSNKDYCGRMIYEIVGSTMTILICKLKEDNYLENLEQNFTDGSILSFIKYYKDILGLEIESVSSISSSIREYLESKE